MAFETTTCLKPKSSPINSENCKPTILLRSSWQTCNIGDISHTLGLSQLIKHYLGNIHVILWPGYIESQEMALLHKYLPELEILDPQDESQIEQAIERANLFLHGSGSGVPGRSAI